MNKKKTKLMATALTATMTAGMATQLVQAAEVTPYEAALEAVITMEKDPSGANIDKAYNAVVALKAGAQKDALNKRVEAVAAPHHKAVYDIMVTARTNKDLKTIGDARKAVAGMAKIFIKDAYTWSSELDNFTIEYQKTVVDTLNAIADGKKEVKQTTINELREIIVGLELQRSNEGLLKLVLDYSATLDKVQMDYVNAVLAEVNAATTDAELAVAKAKYNDLLTMKDEALKAAVQSNIGAAIATKEAELSTPKVESIKVVNAKEVLVKFNKEVDVTTAETATNYDFTKITGASIGVNPSAASVQADGKSVVLTLGTAISTETTFTTTVNGVKVKGTEHDYFPQYAVATTYKDEVKATITDVTSITNGTAATSVVVEFSEPITNATFKVNGSVATSVIIAADGYSATISGLSLDVNKTHTVEALNLTDYANNVSSLVSKTFNVVKDVVAPNVSISVNSDNQLILTFNKKMNANTVNATNIKVKDEYLADLVVSGFTPVDSTNKKFAIDLPAGLYTAKSSRNLTVLLNDSLEDYLGNKLSTQFQNVTTTKDTTAPTVNDVSFVKNPSTGKVEKIVVKFNEGLSASAGLSTAGITVVSPGGADVTTGFLAPTSSAVTKGDTEVEINVTTDVESGKYTFYLPNGFATDIAQTPNNSVAATKVIDFGTVASGEFKISQSSISQTASNTTNTIVVDYKRVVKGGAQAGSATDVRNYTLNGAPLPAGTLITLDSVTYTKATIVLPDETVAKTDTAAILRITGVQDLAGRAITPFIGTTSVMDSVASVLNTAVLNTNGTFTVGFDETLATASVLGDYNVTVNGKVVNASQITFTPAVGGDAGKYVFTVNGLVADPNSTPNDGDEFLYIDADNDGSYDASKDIKVTGAVATAGVVDLNSAAITSVVVSTKTTGPLTGADAAGNTLKLNVSKVVK